jgi:hypothetical protein
MTRPPMSGRETIRLNRGRRNLFKFEMIVERSCGGRPDVTDWRPKISRDKLLAEKNVE